MSKQERGQELEANKRKMFHFNFLSILIFIQQKFMKIQEEGELPHDRKDLPLLAPVDAYARCKNNLFSKENPNGIVNFGLATNAIVSQKVLTYLPSFLQTKDCAYGDFKGLPFLRKHISQKSQYTSDEILVLSCVESLINILAFRKKASYKGSKFPWKSIFHHAQAEQIDETKHQESEIQFIEVEKKEDVKALIQEPVVKDRVLILPEETWVEYSPNEKIIFVFQKSFKEGITCGVCYCRNQIYLQDLFKVYCFHPISTLLSAIIQATIEKQSNKTIQKEFMDDLRGKEPKLESFLQMIEKDSGHRPHEQNFFWGNGSSSCLYNWANTILEQNDKIGIDSPFYFFFKGDFAHSGATFSFRSMFKSKLIDRVKQSHQAGQKCYLIVNPHNPTGHVFSSEQIKEVCEWGTHHQQYHLLFDQMYLQSIHDKQMTTFSAVSYADRFQNIHLIRGFAKDFGLCGFKLGFTISCNKKIKQNFRKWQFLMKPQPYLINSLAIMLEKSKFGQEIYEFNKICLSDSTELIKSLLKKENIDFIEPKGGIFLMIDLSGYLQKSNMSEETAWKQLFHQYRVNISRGSDFTCDKPGFFRLSYLIKDENIFEGIKRIGMFIRKQTIKFDN